MPMYYFRKSIRWPHSSTYNWFSTTARTNDNDFLHISLCVQSQTKILENEWYLHQLNLSPCWACREIGNTLRVLYSRSLRRLDDITPGLINIRYRSAQHTNTGLWYPSDIRTAYWWANVLVSISIILVTGVVMNQRGGYRDYFLRLSHVTCIQCKTGLTRKHW